MFPAVIKKENCFIKPRNHTVLDFKPFGSFLHLFHMSFVSAGYFDQPWQIIVRHLLQP